MCSIVVYPLALTLLVIIWKRMYVFNCMQILSHYSTSTFFYIQQSLLSYSDSPTTKPATMKNDHQNLINFQEFFFRHTYIHFVFWMDGGAIGIDFFLCANEQQYNDNKWAHKAHYLKRKSFLNANFLGIVICCICNLYFFYTWYILTYTYTSYCPLSLLPILLVVFIQ